MQGNKNNYPIKFACFVKNAQNRAERLTLFYHSFKIDSQCVIIIITEYTNYVKKSKHN